MGRIRAVLEASWAILAALVASQVRLGSHLGGILDALESARGVSGRRQSLGKRGRYMQLGATWEVGGPLEDYKTPTRQDLAF